MSLPQLHHGVNTCCVCTQMLSAKCESLLYAWPQLIAQHAVPASQGWHEAVPSRWTIDLRHSAAQHVTLPAGLCSHSRLFLCATFKPLAWPTQACPCSH